MSPQELSIIKKARGLLLGIPECSVLARALPPIFQVIGLLDSLLPDESAGSEEEQR